MKSSEETKKKKTTTTALTLENEIKLETDG